jgi:soluble lytic murein transglycosylase-like protein
VPESIAAVRNGAAPLRTSDGVPTPAESDVSFALPDPAPIGVPNFFIDSFQIPPFLLPIYQAAGIQYDVPWQVLAAINDIETDYGRNLSISSAGAEGWMQFLPSTWKRYGLM